MLTIYGAYSLRPGLFYMTNFTALHYMKSRHEAHFEVTFGALSIVRSPVILTALADIMDLSGGDPNENVTLT